MHVIMRILSHGMRFLYAHTPLHMHLRGIIRARAFFLTYEIEFGLFLVVRENSVLPMG